MKHLALTFSSLCIVSSLNSLRLSNWSRMIVAQSIACLYMLTSFISSVTQKLTDKYVIRFAIWSVIEQIGIRNADCQRKAPSMNFLPRSSLSTSQTKRSPYAQLGGYWTMHASYSCHLKDLFGMFTPAITSHRRTWHLELNIKHIKKYLIVFCRISCCKVNGSGLFTNACGRHSPRVDRHRQTSHPWPSKIQETHFHSLSRGLSLKRNTFRKCPELLKQK